MLGGCIALIAFAGLRATAAPEPAVKFSRDVAPVLVKQCLDCHNAKKAKGGYRLDTFEHLLQSGDSTNPPVTAKRPQESEVLRLLTTGDDDDRMPKKADRLPDAQIGVIERWIEEGAAFDGKDKAAPLTSLLRDADHPAPPEVYSRAVPITAIAFNPGGTELAVSGYHEITLWDPATGELLGRIKKLPERVYGLSYAQDGKLLAAACGTPGMLGEVRLCDPVHRSAGKVLERTTDSVLAVRFSPDGSALAAGGADNAIRIYDVATQTRQCLIEQHSDWVTDLAFSPDGTQLASASRDKSARVFDAKSGVMQSAFLGHDNVIFGVAWDANSKRVYTSGRDRRVRVWNAADGKPYDFITGFEADPFKMEAAFGYVFVACADGIVRQYAQADREMFRAYPRSSDWIYCLTVDHKTRRLATGSYGGVVRVFDLEEAKRVSEFIAAPGYVRPVK